MSPRSGHRRIKPYSGPPLHERDPVVRALYESDDIGDEPSVEAARVPQEVRIARELRDFAAATVLKELGIDRADVFRAEQADVKAEQAADLKKGVIDLELYREALGYAQKHKERLLRSMGRDSVESLPEPPEDAPVMAFEEYQAMRQELLKAYFSGALTNEQLQAARARLSAVRVELPGVSAATRHASTRHEGRSQGSIDARTTYNDLDDRTTLQRLDGPTLVDVVPAAHVDTVTYDDEEFMRLTEADLMEVSATELETLSSGDPRATETIERDDQQANVLDLLLKDADANPPLDTHFERATRPVQERLQRVVVQEIKMREPRVGWLGRGWAYLKRSRLGHAVEKAVNYVINTQQMPYGASVARAKAVHESAQRLGPDLPIPRALIEGSTRVVESATQLRAGAALRARARVDIVTREAQEAARRLDAGTPRVRERLLADLSAQRRLQELARTLAASLPEKERAFTPSRRAESVHPESAAVRKAREAQDREAMDASHASFFADADAGMEALRDGLVPMARMSMEQAERWYGGMLRRFQFEKSVSGRTAPGERRDSSIDTVDNIAGDTADTAPLVEAVSRVQALDDAADTLRNLRSAITAV